MEAKRTQTDAPVATVPGRPAVKVIAPEDVRAAIREHGGSLYIWTHVHGVCEGRVTFLDVAAQRPTDADHPFERLDAGDVDVFLSIGSLLRPEFIELELHGRKKEIRAYWNGRAMVG
jgi:hypothetical protein